ncbi:MAG: hypothetical protein ABEJ03_02000 [Candidatus Nanohaloarchaea archaeon]
MASVVAEPVLSRVKTNESEVIIDQVGKREVEDAWEEVKQEVSGDDMEEVKEQFRILYTSAAVNETLENECMRPVEMGGGAILSYLFDEEGFEALERWRGTGDSDKHLMANGEYGEGLRQSIKSRISRINRVATSQILRDTQD